MTGLWGKRSRRRGRAPPSGPPTEEEIIEKSLDYPESLESEWSIYRLRQKKDHLFMIELDTPLTLAAAAATYNYKFDFNLTLTRLSFYQTDAAGAESVDAITLRANLLTPNMTPLVLYNRVAEVWNGAELTLTGKRSSPVTEFQVVVSGTATNLLRINLQLEVHGISG